MLAGRWSSYRHGYQCCLIFSPPIQTNGAPGSVHVCLGGTCMNTLKCPFSGVLQHISDSGFVRQVGQRQFQGRQSSEWIQCSTCFKYESNAMETANATG